MKHISLMENISGYKSFKTEAAAQLTERRSVFVGTAAPATDEDEAAAFVRRTKSAHADATHNVYAWLVRGGANARCSDDGEPAGTAGAPVLDVIRKSGCVNACVVVSRTFGGILLGAGGLVRAYSAAAKLAVEAAGIVEYEPFCELAILCGYSDYQRLAHGLPKYGAVVDNCEFADGVRLRIAIKARLEGDFRRDVGEMFAGRVGVDEVGRRFGVV